MTAASEAPAPKCWRVWFKDGSACLVDAVDAVSAEREALRVNGMGWYLQRDPATWPLDKVECLN